MKKYFITTIFLLSVYFAYCQNGLSTTADLDKELNSLQIQIQKLQNENGRLKSEVRNLRISLVNADADIDSLKKQVQTNSLAINQTARELGIKISSTEAQTNEKISEIGESLSKNSLYGIIGILLVLLVSGVIFWLLSKKQKTDKTEVIDQLNQTKASIEERLVKEFCKQTELIENQLQLINQQKLEIQSNQQAELDHSLALKVADEITLIERNISFMDKNVKGLKQLLRSVQKLKDNLAANGYDIPELLGKQFHQGMNLVVINSVPDDNLREGDEIISKIIKPQVNYNNRMIQAAQVEVSIG